MDIREEAKRLIERMPSTSTWEDVIHEIYVRKAIEKGLEDSVAGRVAEVGEVRQRFGLAP